jgi:putative zinc finger protein
MTCDSAIELFPWLLNGTLATGERDEVWQHLETCKRCRLALAETRDAWSLFAQHLPSQDVVALAWGETPSEAVEEHLASCPQCAAELELARMSRRLEQDDNVALFPAAKPRPAAGAAPRTWRAAAVAAGLAAVVAATGWIYESRQASDLSARLARAEAPEAPAARPAGETPTQEEGALAELDRLRALQQENEKKAADAAAQVARLERDFGALVRPQAGGMVDLGSGDVVRAGAPETPEKTVKGDQFVTLLLPARGARPGERQAEIVDASGKVVRRLSGLPVTQEFHSIVLPPGSLPPGSYTLRISGREESWAFRVVR